MTLTRDAWDAVMATHSGESLRFGPTNVDRYLGDPKRMGFFFARYAFAAKMLRDCRSIMDVGCGDGLGTVTFLSDTAAAPIVGVDFDPILQRYAVEDLLPAVRRVRPNDVERLTFAERDFIQGAYARDVFDGVCSLDVIEHIEPNQSEEFVARIAGSLHQYGVAVIGTPNANAAEYGSRHSLAGHINPFDASRLRTEMGYKFRRVWVYSMNDCHIGFHFDKLSHYLIGVGIK